MRSILETLVPLSQTTLLILLGASTWPLFPEFQSSQAFANAAKSVKGFFLDPRRFGLSPENLLDLFDSSLDADELDAQIDQFLEQRVTAMKAADHAARDLLVYFIGHGGFIGPDADFYLAIRRTRMANPRASGIPMLSLADTLREKARHLRRIIILDCCFAAAAFNAFQSGPAQVAVAKTQDAFEVKRKSAGFPTKGTTLFCSSGHRVPSLLLPDQSSTLFTKALLDALAEGKKNLQNRLSLRDMRDLVGDILSDTKNAPRPVLLSPDQSDGDIADVPLFPNLRAHVERAHVVEKERHRLAEEIERIRIMEEERQRRIEAERARLSEDIRIMEEEGQYIFDGDKGHSIDENKQIAKAEETAVPAQIPQRSEWFQSSQAVRRRSLARGIVMIVFGLIAIFWPHLTLGAFGIFAILEGTILLSNAFMQHTIQAPTTTYAQPQQSVPSAATHDVNVMLIIEGVLSCICGILALIQPGTIPLAVLTVAAWALFKGISALMQWRTRGWGLGVIGVLGIFLFLITLCQSFSDITSSSWAVGVLSLIMGVMLVRQELCRNEPPSLSPSPNAAQARTPQKFPGALVGLVILLIGLSAGWIFCIRPVVHDMAQKQLDTAMTNGAKEIPPQSPSSGPNSITVTEDKINTYISPQLRSSGSYIQNPVVRITQNDVRLKFQLFVFPCAISLFPHAVNAHLMVSNVNVEGIINLFMSSSEMDKLLNKYLQQYLHYSVTNVQLKDREIDLTYQ